ncbi:MAG: CPBP family intramembrane metalloprotease [Candidatus Omnitrophica bacterium]|nr:CPBP family intramembrane metalloprotease [Candidatus Omnitrophota bacterium]
MNAILRDILNFFRKEKIYFYLLVTIVCFYLALLFVHHHMDRGQEPADHNRERIESLMKAAPENPEMIEKRMAESPRLRWMMQVFGLFFVSSVLCGMWFGSSDLRRLFSKQEFIPSSGRKLSVGWGVSDVIKIMILFFATGLLLNLALAFVKFIFFSKLDPSHFILAHALLLDVAVVFFIAGMVRKKGSTLWDILGFGFKKIPFREIWWGLRTYFVILPLFLGILTLLIFLASRFAYEPPPHPLVEVLLHEETLSLWTLIFSLAVACVVGPVAEEIFFRGFFYPVLRKYFGVGWTVLITAALFAGVHDNIFSFVPILFLGMVLCYLYEKRRNLLACVTLHVVHNTAFITYFFLMKAVLLDTNGGM